MYILSAPNNTIGGTESKARNLVSGNDDDGVDIEGEDSTTTGNEVLGNFIGTNKDGKGDLGNGEHGVQIFDHASGNPVGGNTSGAANTVAFNGGSGVVAGISTIEEEDGSNGILRNSIFSNVGLGIDLNQDGPTANDPGDADDGPNNLQNKPEITSAKKKRKKTIIKGTLISTPNTTFALQFFSNPSGEDEGEKFIGQKSVTTDANGDAPFSIKVRRKLAPVGSTVTATATSQDAATSELRDTSEFSAAVPVS